MTAILESLAPSEQESELAREGSRRLKPHLTRPQDLRIQIVEGNAPPETVEIPAAALRLLVGILNELAEGHAVTLMPIQAELTTQQAADFLNVSRPYLIRLLEEGQIPFHKTGTHRRIFLRDLLSYKTKIKEQRRQSLQELTALSQELGMGY
jgi:excisionase family DNA binding protein